MEILQYGIGPALVLTLYALVDKVLAPLLSKKLANGNGNGSTNGRVISTQWVHQEYVNGEAAKRIGDLEKQADEVRESLSEIRAKVDVSTAILKRVEKSLE